MAKIIMLLMLTWNVIPAAADSANFTLDQVGQFALKITTLKNETTPRQRMTLTYTCEGLIEPQEIYVNEPICFLNGRDWKNGLLTLHYSLADVDHGPVSCDDYAQEFNLRLLCPKH